eukprot:GHVL01013147.1.p1 GENE.GHVL01013147.1~~GHVL01013147.1.p1  ORF type:complete len:363 (+),score=70.12 GHVL01013147.1:25-1113(+)
MSNGDDFYLHQSIASTDNDVYDNIYVYQIIVNSVGTIAAASISTKIIRIFDLDTLKYIRKPFCGHSDQIKFIDFYDSNCLLSCGSDGTARLWDIRVDTGLVSTNKIGNLEILGCSCTDTEYACAYGNSVYVYDIRKQSKLASYEAHSDYTTCVKYHPEKSKILLSGSDDSLVCTYDTNKATDDSALISILNTEDNVARINIIGSNSDCIVTVSPTERLQIWMSDTSNRMADYCNIRTHPLFYKEGESFGYVVDCFYDLSSERLYTLGGSSSGELLLFHINVDEARPCARFLATKSENSPIGHSGVVRSAASHSTSLLTSGEDGRICQWKTAPPPSTGDPPPTWHLSNRRTTARSRNHSPYQL